MYFANPPSSVNRMLRFLLRAKARRFGGRFRSKARPVAIPVMAAGSVLAVTGSALAEAGASTIILGADIYDAGAGPLPIADRPLPDGRPTLK